MNRNLSDEFKQLYNLIAAEDEIQIMKKIQKKVNDFFVSLVKKLFDEVEQNRYDVVILTTRRCLDLVDCVYFLNQPQFESSVKTYDKLISSQSVDIQGESLRGKRVLLVDDIMIHGKAVYSLFNKVQGYNPEIIHTLVFARNMELPDFYKKAADEEYKYFLYLNQTMWKWLSNIIVLYFTSYGIPYLSYLYTYSLDKSNDIETSDILKKYIQSHTENAFSDDSCIFTVDTLKENEYFELKDVDTDVFINIFIRKCKFNYEHKKSEGFVIPYCNLKPIVTKNIHSCWEKFLDILSIEQNSDLYRIKTPSDIYKALTVIANDVLMSQICQNIKLNEVINIDKSYYKNFYIDMREHITYQCKTLDLFVDYIKKAGFEFGDIQSEYIFENDVFEDILIKYSNYEDKTIAYNSAIAEISLKEDKIFSDKLYYSSNINTIIESLSDSVCHVFWLCLAKKLNINNINDFYLYLTKITETGNSSLIIECFKDRNGNEYVGPVIKTGEQSYRNECQIDKEAFIYASKFFDYYVLKYGFGNLNEEEIDKFSAYLSTKGFDIKTSENTLKILRSYVGSELSDSLYSFETLIKADDMKPHEYNIKLISKYFINN